MDSLSFYYKERNIKWSAVLQELHYHQLMANSLYEKKLKKILITSSWGEGAENSLDRTMYSCANVLIFHKV